MGSAIKTFQHDACVFIAQAGAVEGSKASACDAETSGSNHTRTQNIIHDSRKNLKLKENSPFSGISENNRWPRCAQKKSLVYALTCSHLSVFIAVEHFNLTGYVAVHLSKADAGENVTAAEVTEELTVAEATVVVVTAVEGVTGVLTAEDSEPQGK